jgi:hypothetical protein
MSELDLIPVFAAAPKIKVKVKKPTKPTVKKPVVNKPTVKVAQNQAKKAVKSLKKEQTAVGKPKKKSSPTLPKGVLTPEEYRETHKIAHEALIKLHNHHVYAYQHIQGRKAKAPSDSPNHKVYDKALRIHARRAGRFGRIFNRFKKLFAIKRK